ncbi:MAG TPA: hypothetical protein PKE39_05455 [Ignavibacteria bacterium]|nr:hypothetical protein [Ignavibacteria bacterium]HMQ98449.1 hypothetical protein [Ignavibacteria bacterium]
MDIVDSKLVILLKTFSKQEFERFEKFVNSPFFNSSEQLITLFYMLKKDHPYYKDLSKEQIFADFYPAEEYKDKKVRDLLSRMLELAQIFLSQLEFEKNRNTPSIFVMNQLIERNLERHFRTRYKESEKKLREESIIDESYLYSEYMLMKLNREHVDLFKNVIYEEELTKIVNSEYELFLNYVIHNVLSYTLLFSIRKYAVNNEVNLEFSDMVIQFLDKFPRKKYPIISIFRSVLELQSRESEPVNDSDTSTYKELMSSLIENDSTISLHTKRSIYVYLVNYTRLKSLVFNKFFKDEHYRLLKYSIENDLYPKVGNYFSEASYVIVASESLINKDFEWAEKFIEEFKHKLKSEVRENAYTLCMANLNYRKGSYENALRFLVKVSIEDIYYQLKVKNLQVKIHYELGDYEMCKSVIDSFRHFLGSVSQFPEFVKVRFVNYVNFTSRMVNVWLGGDPRNMVEINRELQEMPQEKVESKSWLLAQAAKIKY